MTDEDNTGTFTYVLAGREMVFKKTGRGQLLMLQRVAEILQKQLNAASDAGDAEKLAGLMRQLDDATWTAIESRFTTSSDLSFVQTQIIAGNIVETDLYPILANGKVSTPPVDDADPKLVVAKKKTASKAVKAKAAGRSRAAR